MTLTAKPYNRHWAVYDSEDKLVCVTVYKKGADEVLRRFGDCPEESQEFDPILDEVLKELKLDEEYQNKHL